MRDRQANAAPNSEVHPKTSLAADGMIAEALNMAEEGDTRVLEYLSATAIDPRPTKCPQRKRRRGLPVEDATPAVFIPLGPAGFWRPKKRFLESLFWCFDV